MTSAERAARQVAEKLLAAEAALADAAEMRFVYECRARRQAELISMVLAVPIANEGQMSEVEALAILNVTVRTPKWLLHKFTQTNTLSSARRPQRPPHAWTKPWMCAAGM